ncbi:hypothetical protein GC167_00325 [bacterium]|nr:hypothetical protein [bacterium]
MNISSKAVSSTIPGIDFWMQLLPEKFNIERLRIDGDRSLIHHADLCSWLGIEADALLNLIVQNENQIERGWIETDESGQTHAWLEPEGVLMMIGLVETDLSKALRMGLIRHYLMMRSALANQVEQVRKAAPGPTGSTPNVELRVLD